MKRGTLFLLIILFFSVAIYGQEPVKFVKSTVLEKQDGKEYYIHTIKKGQTLYMISKAYGIEVNELILENPEVKEGIKADQKIRIPTHRPVEQAAPKKVTKPTNPEQKPATSETKSSNTEQKGTSTEQPAPPPPPVVEIACGEDKSALREVYNVALMLPLYLTDLSKIDTSGPDNTPRSFQFIQFYEGFMMAVDSLKKSGTPIQLYVYDMTKDTNQTKKVLKNPELKKMDLIIGMLFQKNFQIVSTFAEKNNIPIVNPISERTQIVTGKPEVFKVYPSASARIPELFNFLKVNHFDDNVLIVRDPAYKDQEGVESLKKMLSDKEIRVKAMVGYSNLFTSFSKEKNNVVVAFTENKVFAIEMLTKLNEFRNDYPLTVVGMPRWDKMDGIEPEYLVNMKTHMMAPSFIDYEDPATQQFVAQFQDRYKTDPDLMAFQGYDIALYFLNALRIYGKAIDACIDKYHTISLQADYEFARTKGNGYENQHWEIFFYENFKLKKAK